MPSVGLEIFLCVTANLTCTGWLPTTDDGLAQNGPASEEKETLSYLKLGALPLWLLCYINALLSL